MLQQYVPPSQDLTDARKQLGGAQSELDEDEPDHEKIAKRTGRVIGILKKTGEGADWFNNVVECGKTLAEFCGNYGALILAAIQGVGGS
ncbi:MAG TPA: hypothetical protein VG347_14545 [Verrucomicrobiae bacterium]|nr:hypothetical protein [Verrucomicrobiae bacterium]